MRALWELEPAGEKVAHLRLPNSPMAAQEPRPFDANQVCLGKPEGSECWIEVSNLPGCHVWNPTLQVEETVTWSGECADGLAHGPGTLNWTWLELPYGWRDLPFDYLGSISSEERESFRASEEATGSLKLGRTHGRWVIDPGPGTGVWEGLYVDGKEHGWWTVTYHNGGVTEGFYESGRERGNWSMSFPNGTSMVGPLKEGKKHGYWVERYASGNIEQGPYVDGARHGRWIYIPRQGAVNELIYEHGSIKKRSVLR